MTGTVGNPELRRDALRILAAGLAAVDPVRLVADALVDDPTLARWSHEIASSPPATAAAGPGAVTGGRTLLIAVGKAALGMARGAVHVLGDTVDDGLVLVPREGGGSRPGWLPPQIRLRTGSHPIPDAETVEAAREVAALARGTGERDRLLVLISGGGSALLTLPRNGVGLEDVRETTRLLLAAGAPIQELNTVRAGLEVLKGGGLARLGRPASVLGLVLSDVVGDDPAVIASGPLTPAPGSPREAETLLRRRGLWHELPPAARTALTEPRGTGKEAEATASTDPGTPPPVPVGPDPEVRVVGGGAQAMDGAEARARTLGYRTHRLTRSLQGEARRAGRGLARVGMAVQDGVAPPAPPACLLATGETTVTVTGPGRGGRNQEVALGAALALSGREGILVAALGTDGIDGPTDAAGGFGDGSTRDRAAEAGMDLENALLRNDAYPLLDSLGDLIRTGPTGTNVADLMLVLVGSPSRRGA